MVLYECPYLGRPVELTGERAAHIAQGHPDLLPEHAGAVAETLTAPDSVRRNGRSLNTRLFARWFPEVHGGKHVVVVVASDTTVVVRHWIVIAYVTRRLARGSDIEWPKS